MGRRWSSRVGRSSPPRWPSAASPVVSAADYENGWNRADSDTDAALLDVATSRGTIHRYNGYDWRRIELGDHPIDAIHRTGRHGLAVSGEGVAYALNRHWERSLSDLPEGLNGATTGSETGDVFCVGENGFLLYRSK